MGFNLSELGNGALQEQFDEADQAVMENIRDKNTEVKTKRKITIEITYETDETREYPDVTFQVKQPKLAPRASGKTRVMLDVDENGQVVGKELVSGIRGQTHFDDEGVKQDDGDKIYDFRKSKEK